MVLPNTAGNPLSAGSLTVFMASSLPKATGSQLKNAYEAIALAVHAGMIAVGFRLVGLGDDDRIEAQADAHDPPPLPTEWNAHNSYAFRYAHSESSMEYIIKVNRLGGKAIVYGIALGADKTTNFDIAVKDYVSEGSLPVSVSGDTSTENLAKILQDVFITAGRLGDLSSLFKISIIQKLAPGLSKQGQENTSTQSNRDDSGDRNPQRQGQPRQPRRPPEEPEPARPYPFNDPLAQPRQPGRPLPEPIPSFEDEYEINRPPRGDLRDGRLPGGLGHDDLYPPGLGPHDPLRPHFGGGLPRPGGMGGGMHPTFDDPLFMGQGGQGGYDPMAPPGARYDPVGPGGAPRDNRGDPRFPGGGGFGGPGGRPPNPFGGFGDGDFI
ncbi:hypothetical protein K458DRAFT_328741 [Lentithecium fluviatile CBS 122367]|uniref:Uncharacterized protein n=1 Tax=Lentithecium fluviatile CBS 122367 TaxID=1168545 RepID=A0A6G1JIU7_9PLEO|nr:hypothetical protein K458DRAFT_328741 [Lentithecium fluviatile CBS 122367]